MVAGPASISASAQTAMYAPDVPIISMCPAPTRPTLTACSTVMTPLTTRAANTPQEM